MAVTIRRPRRDSTTAQSRVHLRDGDPDRWRSVPAGPGVQVSRGHVPAPVAAERITTPRKLRIRAPTVVGAATRPTVSALQHPAVGSFASYSTPPRGARTLPLCGLAGRVQMQPGKRLSA